MGTVLSVIGVLALAYFAYKIYSALLFRYKALKIVLGDLEYNAAVPGWQGQSFLEATKLAKSMRGNEYDAAIIFLLSQLKILTINRDESGIEDTEDTKNFKQKKYELIEKIIEKSKFGDEFISDHVNIKN